MNINSGFLDQANKFYDSKNMEEALNYCESCLLEEPRNIEAWRLKSDILAYTKKYEEAIAAINMVMDLSELEEPTDYFTRGRLSLIVCKTDSAINDFIKVIDLCEFYKNKYYLDSTRLLLAYSYMLKKEDKKSHNQLSLIDNIECQIYMHQNIVNKKYILDQLKI